MAASIQGLTFNSPTNLKAGQSIQFGSGAPLQVTDSSQKSAPVVAQNNYSAAPTQSTGGSNLNIPLPPKPSFDPTPFDNLSASIDQLGSTLSLGTTNDVNAINQNTDQAVSDLNANRDTAQANLDTYKTQATNDSNNNVNDQRRMQSEIQQGIQARYGGTTGTGAFASELSGNTAMNNIAKYKSDLQLEYSKVTNMHNQLMTTYINNKTSLDNNREQQIAAAKQKLAEALSQLQVQKGQVGVARSQQQSAALQSYQSEVNQINANNTEYQRQLAEKASQIQNSLQSKTYEMAYQEHQKLLNFYEQSVANGTLTPAGLTSAEQALGVGGGSLQLPKKTDPYSSLTDPNSSAPAAQPQQTTSNDLLKGVYNFFGVGQ